MYRLYRTEYMQANFHPAKKPFDQFFPVLDLHHIYTCRDIINKIGRGLKKLEVKPDLILSSPYVRAEQTAAILAKEFDLQQHLVFSDLLVPEGKAEAIISAIVDNFMADELFIVGHLPCLNLLASLLVKGGPGLAINIKKGGVCCLSAGDLHLERCADLEWLLPPKILVKV